MIGIEFSIDKRKACCVSGHRNIPKDFDTAKLEDIFTRLYKEKGIETFLVGMAVGFDSVCFKVLQKLRKSLDIKIVGCLPCQNQSERFSLAQKIDYEEMIKGLDQKILVSQEYSKYCFLVRNRFMVDNSEYLVCYLRREKSGTFYTVNYAQKQNKNIIKI